jgi:hypothetical protein
MAADALVFYNSFTEALGDNTIDLDNDTFNVALFTSSYTPNVATQSQYSALTNEVANGNGYTTGGAALTTVTWSQTGGTATFDAADTEWTASGGPITARYAVVYSVTATGNDLVGYVLLDNTPADVTVTDTNTLTIQWHANGIFTLAPA